MQISIWSRRQVLQCTMCTAAAVLAPEHPQGKDGNQKLTSSAIAGARAAVLRSLVRILSYPLDTLKTRSQLPGLEPSLKAPFAGSGYAVIGSLPSGALLVGSFDTLREAGVPRPLASIAASIPPLMLKIPIERLKQRAQAAASPSKSLGFDGGNAHAAREIGFNAIQLAIFDSLDDCQSWVAGALAASTAAIATHPLDVVKTRAMVTAKHPAPSILDSARHICRGEGVGAFALGLWPRALHAAIGGAVFFAAQQQWE